MSAEINVDQTALAAAKEHARLKAAGQPAIMGEAFAELAENAIRFYLSVKLRVELEARRP